MADCRRDSLIVQTELGPLEVILTPEGIGRLHFNAQSQVSPTSTDKISCDITRLLQEYAAGRNVRFAVPVDLSCGTPFQQSVWRVLMSIPRGETRSYAWVAQQVGRPRATRAVGSACGANPVPIIVPCHRVIASDGSIGGFTSGLTMKRRLMALEGIVVQ